jgi:hypothetical protein
LARFVGVLIARGLAFGLGRTYASHHPRPIEIYRGKPILYGCGDVIDDYEGIGRHESFRADLRLLYLTRTDPTSGELVSLQMIPLRVRPGLPDRRRMAPHDHRAHQPPVRDSCRGATRRSTRGHVPAQQHPSPEDSGRCRQLRITDAARRHLGVQQS